MFSKLQSAFWKALTPDLVPDEPQVAAAPDVLLPDNVVRALGGWENLASQQRVALTRVRVQLRDATRLDEPALNASDMPAVMILAKGVVHVVLPMQAPVPGAD